MIQLFTDSAANLTSDLIKDNNVQVISLSYMLEDDPENTLNFAGSLTDSFDPKSYYDAMRNGKKIQTSMVNTDAFATAFEKAFEKGDEILYIGLSAGVSGTLNAAVLALRELEEKYSDRKLPNARVIDSKGAGMGEGMLVLEAAKLIKHGLDVNSVADKTEKLVDELCQCFTVEDLNHLKRTGRISGASAAVGGLLGIKPILIGDNNGKIVMSGKVRGSKRALDNLADTYDAYVTDKTAYICITHADNPDGAEYLKNKLITKGFSGDCITLAFEPAMGAHVGPDSIALFFFGKEEFRTMASK